MPPAFSQSAWVVYCEKSPDVELELGEGLADGEAPAPLGLPEVELPDPVPPVEPVPPEVPAGPPDPEPLAAPLPLPVPPLCAAARAGVSATIATRRNARNLSMSRPPWVG